MTKPRIVYWNNIPAPYVVERFNAVMSRGNIDLEAWFNAEREPDRSWQVDKDRWLFRARYIPARRVLGRSMHLPLPELRETRPDLLISLYHEPTFAIGSVIARTMASRITYRVLPNYDTWSERTWWRELSKHFLFRMVDGAKVPGPDGAALTRKYGLPQERAVPVTQSINVTHYQRARLVLPQKREEERQRLGLTGCVFIYVGRLWSGKGLDYLLEAFRTLRTNGHDISLLLVGDGQDEARYQDEARAVSGVVFTGFVQAQDLPDYYALADVMVFPTLGDPHGLVVEEAMAAGLPVICTQNAGDITLRLPDKRAGFIVPPADAIELAACMERLATDPQMRARFAAETRALVEAKSHDTYARDLEAFVEHVLALPARFTLQSWLAHGMSQLLALSIAPGNRAGAPYVQDRVDNAT